MPNKKKETKSTWDSAMSSVLQGAALTVVFAFVFLAVGAVLIDSGKILEERMGNVVLVACFLGVFLSGMIQRGRTGHWTVINGMLCAAVVCALFAGMGMLIWKKINWEEGRNVVISCLCGGGLAGVLFGKRRKKRRG